MFWKNNFMVLNLNICTSTGISLSLFRSNCPVVFIGKGFLKICSKFTGEQPWWSAISKVEITLEITLRHGYLLSPVTPVNLLHIFRTTFLKNTSGWLLLTFLKLTTDYFLYKAKKSLMLKHLSYDFITNRCYLNLIL